MVQKRLKCHSHQVRLNQKEKQIKEDTYSQETHSPTQRAEFPVFSHQTRQQNLHKIHSVQRIPQWPFGQCRRLTRVTVEFHASCQQCERTEMRFLLRLLQCTLPFEKWRSANKVAKMKSVYIQKKENVHQMHRYVGLNNRKTAKSYTQTFSNM